MMQQPIEQQFLNLSPIQLWSLNTQFGLITQENPSFAYANTTTTPIFDTKITRMAELGAIVARVDERQVELYQELEKVMTSPAERPHSQEIILTGGFRTGRPFKKPTFPIKIIWCKTVICLMDMECDLPERLDFNVPALHGLPRYLSAKEDYFYNEASDAAHNRWRAYSALRNYVTREVEEMVEFICAIDGCNHFFSTRDQVVDHIFAVHKLFPPSVFKCNWAECERQDHFGAFYQVETHIQRHKVERPFICKIPECGKSYRRLENLRTHMRSHNGEKPYKCKYDFCDRCFTNASDRAKHENRTHSSVKGFSCLFDECVKLYTDPSSLRKHIINNHGQETYNMHKQLKAEERKRKVEQRMIDRHINRSLNQSTQGGPMRKNARQKAPAASLSQSPSSSRSSTSAFSNNSPQISPVPVLEAIQPIFATPFSMSHILDGDFPHPILPSTTPMVQLPIRPTPIIPTAVTRTEIPIPILPQLVPLLNFPLPQNLNDNNELNNQLLASFLLAHMQIMSLNSQL